ncbi:hypothetical protein [Rhodobacter sp. NSM]|uniref:hypothetical protein n=1 Tax=Rhodobacter sp. NSM TaxID=3457501 RepID=UPI003FD39CCD
MIAADRVVTASLSTPAPWRASWNRPLHDPRVLRLHAENAAFLADRIELARDGPNERALDLYDLEGRLIGHLAALRRSGPEGLEQALDALARSPAFGELLVAATLSLTTDPRPEAMVHLPPANIAPETAPVLGMALALLGQPQVGPRLRHWLDGAESFALLAALEACSRLRADPGGRLTALLSHRDGVVANRAIRLAGELGRADLRSRIVERLEDCPEAPRAAALLGDRKAAPQRLLALSAEASPDRWREAAELLPLVLPLADAREAVRHLHAAPATRRWAVVAAGALGLPESLDWLVGQMTEPLLARAAGIAVGQITGARLGPENLELRIFPEDPDDPVADASRLERCIESHAYWPDADKIAAWLVPRRLRLTRGERHLLGVAAWTHPEPPEAGERTQLQLRALSLEIACRRPEAPLPDWRAPVRLGSRGFGRDP